jgi:hypothetical protein
MHAPRYGHTSVVVGNQLYLMGGGDRTIESAAIAVDGAINAFNIFPWQLGAIRFGASSTVLGATLYVIGGGVDTKSASTSIERADLQ